MIDLVALDADDTLWHCETLFRVTQERFASLLAGHAPAERIATALAETGRRNLAVYGYGVKGFTLSMLETALDLAGDRLDAAVVRDILAAGREMMLHPVEPLPGVREALETLAASRRLVLVTKGDLFHQEAKLAASGLGDLFAGVEIVSEKTADTYARVFARYGVAPGRAAMAGNSTRSDVLPALAAGSWAALIPYPIVWGHEDAPAPRHHPRFAELATIADLPGWLDRVSRSGAPASAPA